MYALGTVPVPTRVHPTHTGTGYRSTFYPYGAGRFHPQLGLSLITYHPVWVDYRIYKELTQWGYAPIRYGHYNRNPVILSTTFFVSYLLF